MNCRTSNTPMWRRLTDQAAGNTMNLCNACGLYYKTRGIHRPKKLVTKKSQLEKYRKIMDSVGLEADDASRTKVVRLQNQEDKLQGMNNLIRCFNCQCINTSIWRKDKNGKHLCNACGLFLRKNGVHRSAKDRDMDIFIEIDQKLIRFNKIERRKRHQSDHDRYGHDQTSVLSDKGRAAKSGSLHAKLPLLGEKSSSPPRSMSAMSVQTHQQQPLAQQPTMPYQMYGDYYHTVSVPSVYGYTTMYSSHFAPPPPPPPPVPPPPTCFAHSYSPRHFIPHVQQFTIQRYSEPPVPGPPPPLINSQQAARPLNSPLPPISMLFDQLN